VTIAGGVQTVNPAIVDEYWTLNGTIDGHVPAQSFMTKYMPALHQEIGTISNQGGTLSLSSVGYLQTNVANPLTSLNPTSLPPGSFLASGVPDGTLLTPGGSTSFTISGSMMVSS
jgi:hypothetical protein